MRHTTPTGVPFRWAVLGLLGLAPACRGTDVLSPQAVAGTYALRTVAGAPLPVFLPSGRVQVVTLQQDTLVLSAGGALERRSVVRTTVGPCATPQEPVLCLPPSVTETDARQAGTWAVRGDQVVLALPGQSAAAARGADGALRFSLDLGLGAEVVEYAAVR